ncbi:MAG: Spo0B domain-containing protein [Clostridiaceae bacterium]|nr:Spo0B domain-containing protein [Clostridiaceae bacterium]MBW4859605.1 Spo0B domain-containing protein [Clostridiaceae bacterium]MBW4868574.1 Spo0B domain-containing protein [Clostridiaceae bacterium]
MDSLNGISESHKEKVEYISYMKDVFRDQRHDYMNYFQVIYGYLQLGKIEEALRQIKKIIRLNSNLSQIYKMSLFNVSIYLDRAIREMGDLDYVINLHILNNRQDTICFIDNEEEIIKNLDLIFKHFIEEDIQFKRNIDIEIEEFKDRISFTFSGENKISTLIKNSKDADIIEDNERVSVIFKYKNPIECLNIE